MRDCTSKTKLWIGFCSLLLPLVCAGIVFAQGGTVPQQSSAIQILTVQARPGMGPEFEGIIKSEVIPAMRKAGEGAMFTFKTEFGQMDSYLMATPLKSMAELDAPDPLIKALGDKGLAYLMVRLNQLTYSPQLFMVNARPDMGVPIPNGYVPKLAVMLKIKVASDRQTDFEKNNKTMQAILAKANTKGILVTEAGLGGDIDSYVSFALFDSYADIEKFGLELTKLVAESKVPSAPGVIMNREATVIRFLPELSFVPAAPPAAK